MRILYLHGFASGPSSQKASYFRRCFAEHGVTIEIPDLAEGDFEHLTISRQLSVIEREAGGEPVSLIGSSMGGYLAGLYAARHPEVVKLVLLAPAFCFASRWPDSLGQQQMSQWRDTGRRSVFHYGEKREVQLSYEIIEDGLRYEDFPEFPQPALIVHGTADDVVPAAFSEEFAEGRSNVRLLLVPSGHELVDRLDLIWRETWSFFETDLRA